MRIKSQGLTIAGIPLLGVLVWWLCTRERAPFDDADMQFIPPRVLESENGYAHLAKAAAALYLPKDLEGQFESLISIPSRSPTKTPPDTNRVSKEKASKLSWNPGLAQQLMSSNQATFNCLDKTLASADLLMPTPKALDDDLAYLKDYRVLGKIMILQARVDYQAGQWQKAIDQLFTTIQLGDKVQNAGGCFVHFLVGRAIKNMALAQIRFLAGAADLPEAQLQDLFARLQALSVNKLGFTNALKVEYQLCLNSIKNLRDGKGIAKEEMPRFLTVIAGYVAIREGKTRQILVNKFRFILRHSDSNYCDIPLPEIEPPSMNFLRGANMVIRGNPIGELLTQMLPWSSYSAGLIDERVNLTGTKLVVALAGYRKKTGALPNALSDLAPEYLPTVPLDPFDGLPFRYLRDKKIIYSVGRDLQDDKGSSAFKDGHKRDLSFPVDFQDSTNQ